jgi:hypothetical protein
MRWHAAGGFEVSRWLRIELLLIIVAVAIAGCGGSAAIVPEPPVPPIERVDARVQVRWEEPSREVVGPTSAMSARIRITHSTGAQSETVGNRPEGGGLATYTISNVPVGTSQVLVRFYSGQDAQGTEVGFASGGITVATDGSTTPVITNAENTVASVTIATDPPGEFHRIGASALIALTPLDSQGELVAGIGADRWSVTSATPEVATVIVPEGEHGSWYVQFTGVGTAVLTAELDGRSASTTLQVESIPTTNARVRINWPEPSRDIEATVSALSARISLTQDFTESVSVVVNRPAGGGLIEHEVPGAAEGTSAVEVVFYSQPGATGSVVRTATGAITIETDGSATPGISSQVDTVQSVSISFLPDLPYLRNGLDQQVQIIPTALDADGQIVPDISRHRWSIGSSDETVIRVFPPNAVNPEWRGIPQTVTEIQDAWITAELDDRSTTKAIQVRPAPARVYTINLTTHTLTNLRIGTLKTIPELLSEREERHFLVTDGAEADISGTMDGQVVSFGTVTIPQSGMHVIMLFSDGQGGWTHHIFEQVFLVGTAAYQITNLSSLLGPRDFYVAVEHKGSFGPEDLKAAGLAPGHQTPYILVGFAPDEQRVYVTPPSETTVTLNRTMEVQARTQVILYDRPDGQPRLALVIRPAGT